MAQSSVDLLERARAGSDEALGALLQRCERKLLALVRLRLGPSPPRHKTNLVGDSPIFATKAASLLGRPAWERVGASEAVLH